MLDGLRLFAAAGAALVATAGAGTARAQDADMAALADDMLATNPTVLAQRAAVDALAARLRAAQSGYLPSLQANALSQRRQLTIHGGRATRASPSGRWMSRRGCRCSTGSGRPMPCGRRRPNSNRGAPRSRRRSSRCCSTC
ncbi:TolC family protein [Sphingomonas changnyeongensis]|uniref:TolC family protein n=1 Tax=Sphingomonas changnyeongensis TaxID=2698679 RepID=A0A7Z2NVH7_9SPHN|nr:TolC family protein [Sphingomonas changnyeongensis]